MSEASEMEKPMEALQDPEVNSADAESFAKCQLSGWNENLFILLVLCAQMVTNAGVAQGNQPLKIIGDSFHVPKFGQMTWAVAAYSLTVGTFILAAGKLGDMYGPKRLVLIGYLWMALWSLLAGISRYSTFQFFATARGLQGIGPAIIVPNSLSLVGRFYPQGKKRNLIFALFGACAPLGYVLGAVFTSLVTMFAHWSWAYYLGAMTSVVIAAVVYLAIPKVGSSGDGGKFDWLGAATGISGLLLIFVALNQAPVDDWSNPYTYVLLIVGILLMAVFVYVEHRVNEALVPMSVFCPRVVLILGCGACGWGTFGIWNFYLIQMSQLTRGATPLLATAYFSPTVLSGFAASILCAFLFAKKVQVSTVMVIAMLAFVATAILLATVPRRQTYWAEVFVTALVEPFGVAMSLPAATIMLSNLVPRKHQGIAASLVTTVANYSILLALGLSGTVNRYTLDLADLSPNGYLRQTHHAAYFAVGVSGLGLVLALSSYFTCDRHHCS